MYRPKIHVDNYAKLILAIIAICLIYLSVSTQFEIKQLKAQSNETYDPNGKELFWEVIKDNQGKEMGLTMRTWMKNGWFVVRLTKFGGGMTFYSDPNHEWAPAVIVAGPWLSK